MDAVGMEEEPGLALLPRTRRYARAAGLHKDLLLAARIRNRGRERLLRFGASSISRVHMTCSYHTPDKRKHKVMDIPAKVAALEIKA